jgi:hypothetical protein
MFEVDYTTVGSDKFVSLSGTPVTADNVALDTIGGTAQALDGDFYVDGTMVKWDTTAYNLYSQLNAGDNLRIIYDRS